MPRSRTRRHSGADRRLANQANDDGNTTDLATEIGGLIGRLRAQNPTVSDTEITNILTAAYCPVVAQKADASPAEKWELMRQFDRVLMQQLAASAMPPGSLIIANVPLPPAIYQT
jgi:hypothetical protein